MSFSEDKIKFLDVHEHQESFFNARDEDADLPPTQLSGDEQGEQSVYSQVQSKNKANFLLTVTTIIKTVIGSGILALPFTVSKCGYVFASLMFVLATAATQLSATLLLNAKNLSGHSNYASILYHLFHNKFSKSIGSLLIFLNNIGICIAEIIIFKGSIRYIIENIIDKGDPVLQEFYLQPYFIAIIIAVLEIPFTMVKKIEKLRFMAFLGVSGIFVFMTTFVVHYIIVSVDDNPDNQPAGSMNMFPEDWFQALASIPNIFLALSYQMNFFPVYKGMRNVTDKKMANASMAGVIFCSISYLLIGILGYNLIGHKIDGNFLLDLDYQKTNKIIYFVINSGFLISIFFAFPIMFFGCRNNFIALIQLIMIKEDAKKSTKWRENQDNIQQISSYIQSQDRVGKRRKAQMYFLIYTFAIYLVIVGIGVAVDDIEVVFNIVGAICSTSIGVLLPCLFYFVLVNKKSKPKSWKYYLSYVMFIIMAPFAIFSIVAHNIH